MHEYAQTGARFCSVTIPNVTRPCPTCEFMTHLSRNTEMWGTNGSISPVFLVERDKLCPNRGQCRTGDNFSESGTVGQSANRHEVLPVNSNTSNQAQLEHSCGMNILCMISLPTVINILLKCSRPHPLYNNSNFLKLNQPETGNKC